MSKHAYLIIAHGQKENLKYLLRSLDDERNDIFIHADAKWKDFDEQEFSSVVKKSKLFFSKRLNVKWGGYSQIQCETTLIELAVKTDEYDYLHLLSGQDMAIKSQDYIHDFFERNKGKEFLTFCGNDWREFSLQRIKYHFIQYGRNKTLRFFNKIFLKIQKIFRVNRLKNFDKTFVGGCNWASITGEFAKYILSEMDFIKKTFKHSNCADELYKHILAYNSEFKDEIYLLKISEINDDADLDMYRANMRYIDWVRGKPYTFTVEDLQSLIQSEFLFARKFNYVTDQEIQEDVLRAINQ